MAKNESFDVTTKIDLMEVENATNQARKEITQRYDFKGSGATIELKKADSLLLLEAPDNMKLNALKEVLYSKLIRRKVPIENLRPGEPKKAGGDRLRMEIELVSGLDVETCRAIVKTIKDAKLKKVQASIEGEKVRVSGPKRDHLQEVIALLREEDFGVKLTFGNYR